MRISTVVPANKRVKSTTFLDRLDNPSAAVCACLTEDDIEIDGELDESQNASDQRG